MNSKHLVAVALALLGSSAFAGGEFDPARDFPVPGARSAAAPVSARARLADQFAGDARSVSTRSQVAAEARQDGSVASIDQGSEYARVPQGSTLSRDEVRAGARASR